MNPIILEPEEKILLDRVVQTAYQLSLIPSFTQTFPTMYSAEMVYNLSSDITFKYEKGSTFNLYLLIDKETDFEFKTYNIKPDKIGDFTKSITNTIHNHNVIYATANYTN